MQYLHNVPVKDRISFKDTKSVKSRRLISLSPSTAIILTELKEKQDILRKSLGLPEITDNDLVFAHFDGKPLLPESISHAWKKLARQCGLNDIHLHSARHSMATLMLSQNTHPKVVSERLGHSGIEITLNLYSHIVPGMQQAAATKLDNILLPKETKIDKELKEITGRL